jgi:membrane protease YdiL (CAAX protease family)
VPTLTPLLLIAAAITVAPLLAAGFAPRSFAKLRELSVAARLLLPVVLCVPYALISLTAGSIRFGWLALYVLLPFAVSLLLHHASTVDPEQRGAWPDLVVLSALGVAVDLRWFESAWPPQLAVFNKILLLDIGIWGFLIVRSLHRTGFDLRIRRRDLRDGLLNFALYAPIAMVLGLSLGFLHLHAVLPDGLQALGTYVFTFLFVAVPEELFFRGWTQNLLERRIGRTPALLVTSVLFGLAHFNKQAAHLNWRYVLLATVAGVFYGRAWRTRRRIAASAITHATVDTVWSFWLR